MEVIPPLSSQEFDFNSACSSPYMPSSPKRFGNFYFSAPSSPTRASALYQELNSFNGGGSSIPYEWEEKPGTPKSPKPQEAPDADADADTDTEIDFEFGFSGESDRMSLTADELFDGGKIKPLKPPPRLQLGSRLSNEFSAHKSPITSPRSPIAQGKRIIRQAFSPKKRKEVVPFTAAVEQSRRDEIPERGRERVSFMNSKSIRKSTRSLSPAPHRPTFEQNTKPNNSSNTKSSSRKWSFRDFLLFRSASEGRASERDPLRKFSLVSRRCEEKNSSFRSNDGSGSMRRGQVSAHELHYKSNRAVAEEMKRKTFLPYKHGLFGWFR